MDRATVPLGWSTFTLGELFELSNGVNADKSAYGEGIPFINVLDVIENEDLRSEVISGRIKLSPSMAARYQVRYGDVLLNRTSETQDEVGLTSVYLGDAPVVFGGFVFRARPKTNKLDAGYSKYALRVNSVREQIIACGQGGIRANVGQRDLKKVRISLPPLEEQRTITEALSDVDELIKSVRRLIAKKQAIKQGMMQQLLTGRTRLPGFGGDWHPLAVASKSVMKARIGWQGLKADEYRESGTHRLVGGTEFADGRIEWYKTPFVDKWRYDQDSNIQLRPGDVLLTKDGSIGKTAFVESLPGPATLNSGVFVIRPVREAYDPHFMFFMLRSRAFEDFLARLSAGSTISHLYQRDLVTLVLDVPPTLEEQRAIATVLGDAEGEIRALDRRLAKARSIKAGMIQQLLTGRTRLTDKEGAA